MGRKVRRLMRWLLRLSSLDDNDGGDGFFKYIPIILDWRNACYKLRLLKVMCFLFVFCLLIRRGGLALLNIGTTNSQNSM